MNIQSGFENGEISPYGLGNFRKLSTLQASCSNCINFRVLPEGGASYRPGTEHIVDVDLDEEIYLANFDDYIIYLSKSKLIVLDNADKKTILHSFHIIPHDSGISNTTISDFTDWQYCETSFGVFFTFPYMDSNFTYSKPLSDKANFYREPFFLFLAYNKGVFEAPKICLTGTSTVDSNGNVVVEGTNHIKASVTSFAGRLVVAQKKSSTTADINQMVFTKTKTIFKAGVFLGSPSWLRVLNEDFNFAVSSGAGIEKFRWIDTYQEFIFLGTSSSVIGIYFATGIVTQLNVRTKIVSHVGSVAIKPCFTSSYLVFVGVTRRKIYLIRSGVYEGHFDIFPLDLPFENDLEIKTVEFLVLKREEKIIIHLSDGNYYEGSISQTENGRLGLTNYSFFNFANPIKGAIAIKDLLYFTIKLDRFVVLNKISKLLPIKIRANFSEEYEYYSYLSYFKINSNYLDNSLIITNITPNVSLYTEIELVSSPTVGNTNKLIAIIDKENYFLPNDIGAKFKIAGKEFLITEYIDGSRVYVTGTPTEYISGEIEKQTSYISLPQVYRGQRLSAIADGNFIPNIIPGSGINLPYFAYKIFVGFVYEGRLATSPLIITDGTSGYYSPTSSSETIRVMLLYFNKFRYGFDSFNLKPVDALEARHDLSGIALESEAIIPLNISKNFSSKSFPIIYFSVVGESFIILSLSFTVSI